ncbi:sensor domain-containing protein [Glycomyces sp. TRM65418]|uniref:sensor domain-containing protein n=1 Tax=Glycomyces sp. TRM65418 TaxID=2867006 RepID=UPI001CE5B4E6|nr:sensor domain-containing protein [Glycomyces sp. TRM65418]MCC3763945.1 sensor domain-containing protein [Glycomyces sp. TRM65418]QZD53645.1 sensor domain-containing protein [Glycomyces sp. TRM65418]
MNKIFKQLGADSAYLLSSFPIAIPAFVITVTGFAAGIGTAVVWVGVPILAATLLAMRGLAAAGRSQLAGVLGHPIAAPRYKRAADHASPVRRFLTPLTDGQSWLNLLWGLVNFPLAVAGFAVAVAWWAATVASLAYPLYAWVIHRTAGDNDGLEYATRWLGWGDSYLAMSALAVLGGLVMAVLLPLVLRGFALTQAGLGRGLLASLSEMDTPRPPVRTVTADAEVTRVHERLSAA